MLPMDVLQICYAKAAERKLPGSHVAAVIDVESLGRVYANVDGEPRPMILFEPHLFARKLTGEALEEALKLELASKVWNKKLYGKTQVDRWRQIKAAQDLCHRHGISDVAAFESVSYGVGQVLGEHWNELGFPSFDEFYKLMMSGAAGQIDIMLKFIEVNGLEDELRDGRWPAFFRGYNGPQWKKNGYDKKIAAALADFVETATAEPDGMLRMGATGAKVRELQALLLRAGQQVKVDGDFGPSTKKAVKAFQLANGIAVDGVVGPETQSALAKLRQGPTDKPGEQKATEVDGVVKGVGTAIGGTIVADKIDEAKTAVESAIPKLEQLKGLSEWAGYGVTALTVVVAGLAVAGVAWALWSYVQSRRTVEV